MSDLRKTLHSAYSLIRSVELNKATSSLTFDHLIQEQITRLKKGESTAVLDSRGESLGNRPSYYDSLEALEKDIEDVVKAVKEAGNDTDKLLALGIYETTEQS